MCSRHLPPGQPPANQLCFFSLDLISAPRFCQYPQHVLSGGVAVFGVLSTPPRTRFPGGDVRMGAAAPVQIMMLPTTLGGAAHSPRNPAPCVFATARLQGIDITHALSSRDGGVTTPHPQGAPCAIHARRFSFCGCDTLPLLFLIRLLRPRPAPPQRQAAHPRGSAPHHLII